MLVRLRSGGFRKGTAKIIVSSSAPTRRAAVHQAAPAGCLHQRLGFCGIRSLVEANDGHIGPFPGKHDGHGTANAAVTAGDQGALASELVCRAILLGRASWLGPHVLLNTGLLSLLLGWQLLSHDVPSVAVHGLHLAALDPPAQG